MEITQAIVRDLFYYNEGVLFWKIANSNRVDINKPAGSLLHYNDGSVRCGIRISGRRYYRYRLIFLYHKGLMPKLIDHENRNSLDDRIENLREATYSQNLSNVSSAKGASSKYLGVTFIVQNKNRKIKNGEMRVYKRVCFRVEICHEYKHLFIGEFKLETDAALAYNREAVRYHKEFANLNIIQIN